MRVSYTRVNYPITPFWSEKENDRLTCCVCHSHEEELYMVTCGHWMCESCAKKEHEVPAEDVICASCGEEAIDGAFEIDGETFCDCCATERIWDLPRITI